MCVKGDCVCLYVKISLLPPFPTKSNRSSTVWCPMLKAVEHFRGPVQSWRICMFLHSKGSNREVDVVVEEEWPI